MVRRTGRPVLFMVAHVTGSRTGQPCRSHPGLQPDGVVPIPVVDGASSSRPMTWQPINTAPKSTSTPTTWGHDVRGVYLLGYCPDESAHDPSICICVIWWEPHLDGGRWQGEANNPMRPRNWMPLPAPPYDVLQAALTDPAGPLIMAKPYAQQ